MYFCALLSCYVVLCCVVYTEEPKNDTNNVELNEIHAAEAVSNEYNNNTCFGSIYVECAIVQ